MAGPLPSPTPKAARRIGLGAGIWLAGLLGVALWLSVGGSRGCVTFAAATVPADYCYKITVTASSSSNVSFTNLPVRFQVNSSDLVDNGQLDQYAWEMLNIGTTASQEVGLTVQSMSSTTAGWWIEFPSIPSGASRTGTMFFGFNGQQRDQGFLLAGTDTFTAAHNALFNISDYLNLSTEVEVLDETIASSTIAAHYSASQGYKLELAQSGGSLRIFGYGDNTAISAAWDSDWTNVKTTIELIFTSPDLNLLVNDEVVASSTAQVTLDTPTTPFEVGTNLTRAYIRDVKLFGGNPYTVRSHWGFDGAHITETVATNPFQGSVDNYVSGSPSLLYTLNRNWMVTGGAGGAPAITTTVSRLQRASAPPVLTVPTVQPSLYATPYGASLFTPVPTSTGSTFFDGIIGGVGTTGQQVAPPSFMWALFLGPLSLLIAAAFFAALNRVAGQFGTMNIVLAMLPGGFPIYWGTFTGHLVWWWSLLWMMGMVILAFAAGQMKRPA